MDGYNGLSFLGAGCSIVHIPGTPRSFALVKTASVSSTVLSAILVPLSASFCCFCEFVGGPSMCSAVLTGGGPFGLKRTAENDEHIGPPFEASNL